MFRPKSSYQAVTWKENLDAFNRRLRRGSLSLDAAVQEEEELLVSHAGSQTKAQQHQQQAEHLDQDGAQARNVSPGLGEHAQLLGSQEHSKPSYNAAGTYGATAVGLPFSENGRSNQNRPNQQGARSEPVFPTQLNPALATTKRSKLGVFSGVFVPCVLSIWGIILFLRFGFIIGQAGVMGTMAMFIVGYAINVFTTLSLSAISTNGTVRGGGVYYLLSRSLGPEFGGSIGLIYFLCTVIGCGMNVLGFVEPLIANFGEVSGTMYRVLPEGPLWGFIYGTILLISCTLVCLVGSKLFARSSLVLAVIILISTLSIFVSFAFMPPFTHPERNIEYTGFSWDTLQENMWPNFTTTNGPEGAKQSFQTVFGVLFPACIGILAGASMSGDLEDPSKSIPKGTLWAVGSTFCVYTLIVILMGGSISRSTMYTDLSVLQDVSISPIFIASGGLAASVFATLGCVIGAAKILQAIARDNLLPLLSVFGQGTPKTDEPTLAVLLTYILCQFCLLLTDMNAIATFVSLITLLTFLILNLACFLLKVGSAPNFRPSFRFFHWWTAFGGMVLSAVVMCYVDLGQSLLSGLMTAVLFIWIHYWSPPKRWGDVTQSLIYHQVRKYLLRLDSRKEHVKFWRPQILLLVHHPRSEYNLIQFCNHLKKGALYVLGHVILGDLRDVLQEFRRQQSSWLKFVDVLHIKAFVNLSVADSVRIGARNLLIGTGLGGMRPNIVVLGSFNLQRYLLQKQKQQPNTPEHHVLSPDIQKGSFMPATMNNPCADHTLLNVPVSLPIDNIRVETPIAITDYVSIIEDVLSLNKAVAIGYGFERLELPEEHKALWNPLNLLSLRSSILSLKSLFTPQSRPSSLHKVGESNQKRYIDLWPMQMSMAPMQCMGCILHMVPLWKDNYSLRVMVFVEYKEDVEEERKRLSALLENLRIPAEVNVMCLDGGDSETYARLVRGENLYDARDYSVDDGFESDGIEGTEEVAADPVASITSKPGPWNINPRWQQHEPLEEEDEEDEEGEETEAEGSSRAHNDGHYPSREVGSHSNAGDQGLFDKARESSSPSISLGSPARSFGRDPILQPSGPPPGPPQRRRTISHPDNQQQRPARSTSLRVNTALSPRLRHGSPIAAVSAHPSSSPHRAFGSGGGGVRYRGGMAGSTSPMESRLGTSAPLNTSMNFRIAVPLPRQYLDTHGTNSESESDSMSSEDDEDYDRNDDDLVYSGVFTTATATTTATSLGLASAATEQDSINQAHCLQQQHSVYPVATPQTYQQQQQQQRDPLSPTANDSNSHPWATSAGTDVSSFPTNLYSRNPELQQCSMSQEMAAPEMATGGAPILPGSPPPPNLDSFGFGHEDPLSTPPLPLPPIQFDHLSSETQLRILNELMRIHSSAETTSIIFTTVPAPEPGTCLREESSLAYLENLDLLMEGIDVPVLLLHAKSLTVTMTL
ncbi:hypothetical protein BGZ54_008781 [Gamsiella multidivaricata]|nr:hypothetical protein BGZ54_008781 [Gamsiella multidivaricata]